MNSLIRHRFLFVSMLLVLLVSIYIINGYMPVHDTLYQYQLFYSFYSHFYFYNNIQMWFPYGSYGIAATFYQITVLTPFMYVVAVIGKILGVQDTLLLYYISIGLSFLTYLLGFYLLFKELVKDKFVQLSGLIIVFCTISLLWQALFEQGFIYLIPMALFCILKLKNTREIKWLYALIFLSLIDVIGLMASYVFMLQFYTLLIVLLFVVLGDKTLRQSVFKFRHYYNFRFILLLLLAACLCAGLFYSVHDTISLTPLRGKNFGVSLKTFLTYGEVPFSAQLYGFITGLIAPADNTFYIGLMPLFLVVYGVFRVRGNAFFYGILAAAAFLFFLANSHFFATLVYYLPGMFLYRFIDMVFSLLDVLLIILFVLTLAALIPLVKQNRSDGCGAIKNIGRLLFSGWGLREAIAIGVIVCFLISASFNSPIHVERTGWTSIGYKQLYDVLSWKTSGSAIFYFRLFCFLIFFRFVFWAIRLKNKSMKKRFFWLKFLFILVLLIDAILFQATQIMRINSWDLVATKPLVNVEPLYFVPKRTPNSEDIGYGYKTGYRRFTLSRLLFMQKLRTIRTSMGFKSEVYFLPFGMYANFDSCLPFGRVDLLSKSARGLITKKRLVDGVMHVSMSPKVCGLPRLFLIKKANYTNVKSVSAELIPANMRVENFFGSKISLTLNNPEKESAYLHYADLYSSAWKASLDGALVPVKESSAGYKLIKVPPGAHHLTMWFDGPIYQLIAWFVALFGLLAGLFLLYFIVINLVKSDERP